MKTGHVIVVAPCPFMTHAAVRSLMAHGPKIVVLAEPPLVLNDAPTFSPLEFVLNDKRKMLLQSLCIKPSSNPDEPFYMALPKNKRIRPR